ncbi:hypothetical protein J6590_106826 [Homalodisca vitripennis]|nr:hypothetical protein J6590_106826 [Homalodisca vitripennis]
MYDKFRRQPLVLSAIELAQKSDHRAVGLLLTYQGQGTLPYWLTVLSNFPETTNPAAYKDLLPECSAEGEIFPWEQFKIRDEDWCENSHFE